MVNMCSIMFDNVIVSCIILGGTYCFRIHNAVTLENTVKDFFLNLYIMRAYFHELIR